MGAAVKKAPAKKSTAISAESVKAKTGKSWDEWFVLLDKRGARKLDHKAIVSLTHSELGSPGWWSQMIAVEYERKHGLRVMNQSCAGDFQGSVSRTLPFAVAELYRALTDAKLRAKWLPRAPIEITKANQNKNVRMKWTADGSNVEARFTAKSAEKTQLVFDHTKLADAKGVAKSKAYWSGALDRLAELLG
jgi:uncharacterized protein YndB with AHSA1/START domain